MIKELLSLEDEQKLDEQILKRLLEIHTEMVIVVVARILLDAVAFHII